MMGLILGNGRSRLKYSLDTFRDQGYVIGGCNAIYRDARVDALCSVDEWMIKEIESSEAHIKHPYWIRTERNRQPGNQYVARRVFCNGEPLFHDRGFKSGPTLAWAFPKIYPEITEVHLIGIDMTARPGETGQNNVYVNTKNYKPEWQPQTATLKDYQEWSDVFTFHQETLWVWHKPWPEAEVHRLWARHPNFEVQVDD